jgi:hypothetical protein
MPEEKDQTTTRTEPGTTVAGEAKSPVIDFNEVRRQVALAKAKRGAYRSAIRETLTISPTVEVEFRDGQKFQLEFTLKTAMDFFKDTGKNIAQGELRGEDLEDLDMLVKVLWYGMAANQSSTRPTQEELLGLISLRRIPYYQMMVSDALEAILPDTALVKRLEMEMKEDPELLPFLQTNGGPGSGPSGSEY